MLIIKYIFEFFVWNNIFYNSDCESKFYQIDMKSLDIKKTALNIKQEFIIFVEMSYNIKNASATF